MSAGNGSAEEGWFRPHLRRLCAWLHPDLGAEKEALIEAWRDQAITSLKLLGAVLIGLAIFSQILLRLIHTAVGHGELISTVFFILGAILWTTLLLPFRRRIARAVLLAALYYLIDQSLYFELTIFEPHQFQLGLFIAAVCFISFTFLPYRPWTIALFGILSLFFIGALGVLTPVVINPREDTTALWLSLEIVGLTVITCCFRAAILNLQLNIRRSAQALASAQEDLADVTRLLTRAESQHMEYKASLRWDRREMRANVGLEAAVVKCIAGFLNSQGGTLVLGVDDRGQTVGLEGDFSTLRKRDSDGFEMALMQLVIDRMGPEFCALLRVNFVEVEEKTICVVRVQPAAKPVYVAQQKNAVFYVRTGNSTQQLDTRRAVEYIQSRWSAK